MLNELHIRQSHAFLVYIKNIYTSYVLSLIK